MKAYMKRIAYERQPRIKYLVFVGKNGRSNLYNVMFVTGEDNHQHIIFHSNRKRIEAHAVGYFQNRGSTSDKAIKAVSKAIRIERKTN